MKTSKTATPALALLPSTPALRVPRLSHRQAVKERARKAAARANSFDPLQYTLRAKAKRDHAAARNTAAPGGPADRAAAPPTLAPRLLRPLVLARPLVREGGEDYRRHPSRLTPQTREAYWAGSEPASTASTTSTTPTARSATPPVRKPAAAPTPPSRPAPSAPPRPAAGRKERP